MSGEVAVLLPLVLAFLGIASASHTGRQRFEDFPPRIVEQPSDVIVSKGEPATLNCRAEGRPAPVVEWFKDGERVHTAPDDPRSHRMLLTTGSLFFLMITHGRRSKSDEGVYVCVVRNHLGQAVSRNASLEVAVLRDDFRQAPSDVVVAAGEPAVLECVPPRGHPEPTISWKRNNVRLSSKDGRIAMRGGRLMISHTRKSDAGMYVCVGSNMVGERDSDPAELVVFERPVFMRRPVNQIVLADDNVDFLCEVHGDPAPTIRWRRDHGELPRERFEIRGDSTLRLLRVRQEDEGTYTCVTENSVGKTEASATLQVHGPPLIDIQPKNQKATQGQTVTFHCGTTGNPQPAVFWQKEGSQVLLFPGQPPSQYGRYTVSMSGELRLTDIHHDDAGYYICQAISVAGSTLAKAHLEVESGQSDHFPPIIRQGPANQTLPLGSTVSLPCQVIGQPLPSIHWEREGQPIQAEGRDVRATLMENGTLQITDLKATDSGTYTCIASSPAGESSWSGALTVRADGASGVPPPPRHSDSIQLPGPPQKPLVTAVTERSVTLTWQPNPHEGGAAVTSYVIEAFSQSEGSVWQTVADLVQQERHVVGGLNPNTVYLFIVRALNSYGLSDPSPISEPVRTHDGDPTEEDAGIRRLQTDLRDATVFLNPPTVLGPNSIHITWTLEGYPESVQGYRLLYRPRGSAWLVQDLEAGPDLRHTLAKLRRGTEYDIKLRPFFTHRQGADSQLVTVRTPDEVLSNPPQNVRVSELANSSQVQVTWEPPATPHNGLIQHYQIWCVSNDSQVQVNRSVEASVLSCLLEGLLPHSLYRVQVAAVTTGGAGPPSQPVTIFYKPVVPARSDDVISLSEQIRGVVGRPAFLAGLGGALWLALMTASAWVYCRHRRRKQLGHYTTSFSYTPAGMMGYANSDGIISGRPDMLGSDLADYPWLADAHSWPHANLTHTTSQDSAHNTNYCAAKQPEPTDRYYNTVGISKYLTHSEKFSPSSADGPIYSTINPHHHDRGDDDEEEEDLPDYTSQYSQYSQRSKYSQQSRLQYSQHSSPAPPPRRPAAGVLSKADLYSLERDLCSWSLQSGHSTGTAEYAKVHTGNAQHMESLCKSSGSLDWADVLDLTSQSTTREHTHSHSHSETNRDQHSSDDDDEDWAPPLPERTYLMDTLPHDSLTLPHHDASTYGGHNASTLPHDSLTLSHDTSTLPLRGGTLEHHPPSYSASHSLQSAITAATSHRDPQTDRTRPLDLLLRSPGHAPGSPYHQSCSTLMSNPETGDLTVPRLSSYWHDIMQIEGPYSADSGKGQSSAFASDVISQPPKPHGRKKHSRDGQSRKQHNNSADLPPPPAPPPGSERLQLLEDMLGGFHHGQFQGGSLGGVRGHCGGSMEGGRARMTGHTGTGGSTGTGQRRKDRPAPWNPEDEDLLLQWKMAGSGGSKGQSGVQGGRGGGGLGGGGGGGSPASLSPPSRTHTPSRRRRQQNI